jgi:antitoxin VapB
MALNIKDPVTDRLARELARATGESITVSLRVAIEDRLRRIRARERSTPQGVELHALIRRGRAREALDDRPAEQILGYDEHGLPT